MPHHVHTAAVSGAPHPTPPPPPQPTQANKTAGLTDAEVLVLRERFGPNELDDGKRSKLLLFLSFFWGPMPIMIWAAIIIDLAMAIKFGEAWPDFSVLMALQFANAIVGFIEESNAGDAIEKLKQQLAPKTHVCRNGVWGEIPAKELVPGDLLEMKLGDVVPADAILLEGLPVLVDQAALTGESLPATAGPGSLVFMSSALKQGHIQAVVVATGKDSFMGNAARLMASVVHKGRLHHILLNITIVLCILCILACAAIFAKLMTAPEPPGAVTDGAGDSKGLKALAVVVVILVASIPVAIEVVVTSTMAVGSHVMSHHKVIVARLSAIEELAGMTVLCSDKTGTLTLNQLELREPLLVAATSRDDAVYYAALASKRTGNMDAIDKVIADAVKTLPPALVATLNAQREIETVPFDPVSKRTVVTLEGADGVRYKVAKGAPQVILRMAHNYATIRPIVEQQVNDLASRGFRALGVALARDAATERWEYMSVLSLFDPPRHDTAATIRAAIANGVDVKMVTGDQAAIAKETCRQLGMGTNILRTDVLDADMKGLSPSEAAARQSVIDHVIMEAHGFAEVMPEHKFLIVERIEAQGHVTGMTGDGVNDAPALKRADIGIAVHGATDAAKAAAAIVLTEPGLSVIIDAIFLSRQIFQRMRNYIIYRIACTMQLLFFFFFGILTMDADSNYMYGGTYADAGFPAALTVHAPHFTLPVISLVIITILNDGCMITISHDKVTPNKLPQTWDMFEVWVISIVLGAVACLSSLILLAAGMHANFRHPDTVVGTLWGAYGRTYITWGELKTIMYLKISISDFLTLFAARSRTWFWERCLGRALGIAFVFATAISTIFSLFWADFITVDETSMASLRHSPGAAFSTWVYCILWFLLQDIIKVGAYTALDYLRPAEEKAVMGFAAGHSKDALPTASGALSPTAMAAEVVASVAVAAAERAATTAATPAGEPAGGVGGVLATIGRAAGITVAGGSAPSSTHGRTMSRMSIAALTYKPGDTINTARRLPDGVNLNAVVEAAHSRSMRELPVATSHPALRSIFPGGAPGAGGLPEGRSVSEEHHTAGVVASDVELAVGHAGSGSSSGSGSGAAAAPAPAPASSATAPTNGAGVGAV